MPMWHMSPYVYAFELPVDMDEGTQDKIQAAVKEGVELTNKINQFVPGGVLGDPLFNANTSREDKAFPTFLTLDPSMSNFKGHPDKAPQKRPSLDLTDASDLNLQQTAPFPQVKQVQMSENLEETRVREAAPEPQTAGNPPSTDAASRAALKPNDTGTLSISDKDMLIEDMEGSVLEKMPLKDILSARTKYDMFVDARNTTPPVPQTQAKKEEKLEELVEPLSTISMH